MPDQEELNRRFEYCPETGSLSFRYSHGAKRKGETVGCLARHGYFVTRIDGRLEYVHRVIWVMHNGPIPTSMFIDHIDRNRGHNHIENLRLVSHSQNMINTGRSHPGVCYYKRLRSWRAYISRKKQRFYLGYHSTFAAALAARREAELRLDVVQ